MPGFFRGRLGAMRDDSTRDRDVRDRETQTALASFCEPLGTHLRKHRRGDPPHARKLSSEI